MRKKMILLLISIIIPILGTIGIALYDYNVRYSYDSTKTTNSEYRNEYRNYLDSKLLEIIGEEGYTKQTLDRIRLYRQIHSYYFIDDPIYSKEVIYNNKSLFSIIIYKNLIEYTPSANVSAVDRIRYEVYIYDVDYEALKELFMDSSVLPANKNVVKNADYPSIVINFFPNDTYTNEEALVTNAAGDSYVYNAVTKTGTQTFYGTTLNNTTSAYALYDYKANPSEVSEDTPNLVKYLGFNDYTSIINISDENDTDVNNNRDRFDDGAFVKVDLVLQNDTYYTLNDSLLKDQISDMNFSLKNIDYTKYNKGFEDDISNINADDIKKLNENNSYAYENASKIKTYTMWITTTKVWWQCLICLVALGIIMTGFYFTFTYEEPNIKKINKKKK